MISCKRSFVAGGCVIILFLSNEHLPKMTHVKFHTRCAIIKLCRHLLIFSLTQCKASVIEYSCALLIESSLELYIKTFQIFLLESSNYKLVLFLTRLIAHAEKVMLIGSTSLLVGFCALITATFLIHAVLSKL